MQKKNPQTAKNLHTDKIKIKQAKLLKSLSAFRTSSFPQISKPWYKEMVTWHRESRAKQEEYKDRKTQVL